MSNRVWFTADTHFGHPWAAVGLRGFVSVKDHDEVLIERWNSQVKKGDRVYHLGDFSLGSSVYTNSILLRLNGEKFLIRGNHDKSAETALCRDKFVWIRDAFNLKVENQRIWLSHYAHRVWPNSYRGSWHLYGHSHGTLRNEFYDAHSFSLDVGIDAWLSFSLGFGVEDARLFCPISFETIVSTMSYREFEPVDRNFTEDDEE